MKEDPFFALHEINKSVLALLAGTGSNGQGRPNVSDDQHRMLNFLYGPKSALTAWEAVESGRVELLKGVPSGRSFYRVHAEPRKSHFEYYVCFLDGAASFCSCQSFVFKVVQKEEHIYCKHLLAAELAKACGMVKNVELPDVELGTVLACSEPVNRK
eukprot:jgi/Mesvir1/29261/Mv08180-RA.1